MKKVVAVFAATILLTTAFAQKKNIQTASNSLRNKEYQEAVKYIDLAVNDPSTQDDPKAWLKRGEIFLAMDSDPGYADKGYYEEVVKSYMKVLELKPGYETNAISSGLIYGAYKAYNKSVKQYNAKNWSTAYNAAKMTVDIHSKVDGKNFVGNTSFDTVAAGAMTIQAYSAFYDNKPEQALTVLEKLKENPIEGNANTYLIITDAYRKLGNTTKELATIEEAKAKYPKDKNIRNEEINYYIRTNQQDKLIKKLEAAVATEPENPIYQYNLANAYTNLAFPKDNEGKSMPKPSNFDELIAKAEAGFEKALAVSPDNMGYHYDIGVLHFNQAAEVTEEMNNVPTEDDKTYNELKAKRKTMFDKAFPHFEKIYTTFEPKISELDTDNKNIYIGALTAMKEIYARRDMMDKANELKQKIDAVR